MAIYVVDGLPRHGKTAWVVSHVPKWLKEARDKGWKLYSNVWIKVEQIKWITKAYKKPTDCIGDIYPKKDRDNPKKLLYYWRDLDAWEHMTHGTIIADEAQRYFNARRWQTLSDDIEMKLTQHGKDELDVYACTQHYTRIDAVCRVITEKFYRVTRTLGFGNTTWTARITEHYLHELERWERNPEAYEYGTTKPKDGKEEGGKPVSAENFIIWPWIKRLYDTKQQVLPSKPMLLKHVERHCGKKGCKLHKKPKVTHL